MYVCMYVFMYVYECIRMIGNVEYNVYVCVYVCSIHFLPEKRCTASLRVSPRPHHAADPIHMNR